MSETLTVPALFDAHVHLRQDALMEQVAPFTSRVCDACVVMPNVVPPLDNPDRWQGYYHTARASLGTAEPLVAFKITRRLAENPGWVAQFKQRGCRVGKLYPDGVTTNAHASGVDTTALHQLGRPDSWLRRVLEDMAAHDLVLSLHGEMPDSFCLERERDFLSVVDTILLVVPNLRVVLEHISTAAAVWFVRRHHWESRPPRLAATVTLHHLMLTLDDVIGDTLRPHHYFKPVAKCPGDRAALRHAAFSGLPYFFLGSDSAPHAVSRKESACGCAGIFSAPVLPEGLLQLCTTPEELAQLPGFTSRHGRVFYGLPPTRQRVRLEKKPWRVPDRYGEVEPFLAGQTLDWQVSGWSEE